MSRFVTLADLQRADLVMWLQCNACTRISHLSPARALGLPLDNVGIPTIDMDKLEAAVIEQIVPRLRCKKCGKRDVQWTPMRASFTGAGT